MASSFAELHYNTPPDAVGKAQREYAGSEACCPNSNFLKGVLWSPDGTCLLTASDDNRLRVYAAPSDVLQARSLGNATESSMDSIACQDDTLQPHVAVQEGEMVYDYAWFPGMTVSDPASCCFATSCRAHPIHLWDATSGTLRCSYRAYDDNDEVMAANSIAFSPDGSKVAAGANKSLRLFDTATPGRKCMLARTHKRKGVGQPGIISCLAFNLDRSGMLAAGAYSGTAAIYDEHTLAPAAVLEGHRGGITQVQFSVDGNFLYTGARQDDSIMCWDIRNTGEVLYSMQRDTRHTNQRIHFTQSPNGRHLATGGTDGVVKVFDLVDGSLVATFLASHDTVNGCHFHPYLPLLSTASGQRRFQDVGSDASSDDECTSVAKCTKQPAQLQNALMLWRVACTWPEAAAASSGATAAALDVLAGSTDTVTAEDIDLPLDIPLEELMGLGE